MIREQVKNARISRDGRLLVNQADILGSAVHGTLWDIYKA